MRETILLIFTATIYGATHVAAAPAATINGIKTQNVEEIYQAGLVENTANVNIQAKVISENYKNENGVRTEMDLYAYQPFGSPYGNIIEEVKVQELDGNKNAIIENDIVMIKENDVMKVFNKTKKVKKLKKVRKIRRPTSGPHINVQLQNDVTNSKEANTDLNLNNNNLNFNEGVVDDGIYFSDEFQVLVDNANFLEFNNNIANKNKEPSVNDIISLKEENNNILSGNIEENGSILKSKENVEEENDILLNGSTNDSEIILLQLIDEKEAMEQNTDAKPEIIDEDNTPGKVILDLTSQEISASNLETDIESSEKNSNDISIKEISDIAEDSDNIEKLTETQGSIENALLLNTISTQVDNTNLQEDTSYSSMQSNDNLGQNSNFVANGNNEINFPEHVDSEPAKVVKSNEVSEYSVERENNENISQEQTFQNVHVINQDSISYEINDLLESSAASISDNILLPENTETVQLNYESLQNSIFNNNEDNINEKLPINSVQSLENSASSEIENSKQDLNSQTVDSLEQIDNFLSENNDSLEPSLESNIQQLSLNDILHTEHDFNQEKDILENKEVFLDQMLENKSNTEELLTDASNATEDVDLSTSNSEIEASSDLKEASLLTEIPSKESLIDSLSNLEQISELAGSQEILQVNNNINDDNNDSENLFYFPDNSLEFSQQENSAGLGNNPEELSTSGANSIDLELTVEEENLLYGSLSESSSDDTEDSVPASNNNIFHGTEKNNLDSNEINPIASPISNEIQIQEIESKSNEQTISEHNFESKEASFQNVDKVDNTVNNNYSPDSTNNKLGSELALQSNQEQITSVESQSEIILANSKEDIKDTSEMAEIITDNNAFDSKELDSNNEKVVMEDINNEKLVNDEIHSLSSESDGPNNVLGLEKVPSIEQDTNDNTSDMEFGSEAEDVIVAAPSIEKLENQVSISSSSENQVEEPDLNLAQKNSADISSSEAYEETGQYVSDIEVPHSSFEYSDYFEAFEDISKNNNNNEISPDLTLNEEVASKFSNEIIDNSEKTEEIADMLGINLDTDNIENQASISSSPEIQEKEADLNLAQKNSAEISNSEAFEETGQYVSDIELPHSSYDYSDYFEGFEDISNNYNNDESLDLSLNVEVASKFSNEIFDYSEKTEEIADLLSINLNEDQEETVTHEDSADISSKEQSSLNEVHETHINVINNDHEEEEKYASNAVEDNNANQNIDTAGNENGKISVEKQPLSTNSNEEQIMSQNESVMLSNVLSEEKETNLIESFDESNSNKEIIDVLSSTVDDEKITSGEQENFSATNNEIVPNETNAKEEIIQIDGHGNQELIQQEHTTESKDDMQVTNTNEPENSPKRKKVKKLKKRPKVPKTPEFMQLLEENEPIGLDPSFLKPAIPVPVMFRPEYRNPL